MDWSDWKEPTSAEDTKENLDSKNLFEDMEPKLTRPRMVSNMIFFFSVCHKLQKGHIGIFVIFVGIGNSKGIIVHHVK